LITFEVRGNYLEFSSGRISGSTAVYALIGDPIDHSLSPTIQNVAFRSAEINAVYVALRVTRQSLRDVVKGLRASGVKGFNVTTPHKVSVQPYLDMIEPSADAIGSVNTVINENRKLRGYNTEGVGALKALEEAGVSPDGKSVLIFGAGGASRAIAYTLAHHASSIRLVNRTVAKSRKLVLQIRRKLHIDVEYASISDKLLKDLVEQANIVINASSMGMEGVSNPPVAAEWLRHDQCVFDIVYKPPHTRLLELAGLAGAKSLNGLDMLVNQGACAFELWTGRGAPIIEMRRAMSQNILAMEHAKSS
jgi:shikimate dehydrogenase